MCRYKAMHAFGIGRVVSPSVPVFGFDSRNLGSELIHFILHFIRIFL